MQFVPGGFYHVFNRGNNQQPIFFKAKNYDYFLGKIRKNLTSCCEILAYCLMPNHFHLMIYVPDEESVTEDFVGAGSTALGCQNLPRKIGTMLSSYTQAINIQENRTGSLFQQKTKAVLLEVDKTDYPLICLHYIHQNPVKAGLVSRLEDWKYSSFNEYMDPTQYGICNTKLAHEFLDIPKDKVLFYQHSIEVIGDETLIERLVQ